MPLETPPKSLAPALTAQRRWSSVASSPQSTPWGSGTRSSPAHSLPRDRSFCGGLPANLENDHGFFFYVKYIFYARLIFCICFNITFVEV